MVETLLLLIAVFLFLLLKEEKRPSYQGGVRVNPRPTSPRPGAPVPLVEGATKTGGVNLKPKTPRPDVHPVPLSIGTPKRKETEPTMTALLTFPEGQKLLPPNGSRVFICSPLSGKTEEEFKKNQRNAMRFCRFLMERGYTPYAPHLFFTLFLDDASPEERALGISHGIEELKNRDWMAVFRVPGAPLTEGMQKEWGVASDGGIVCLRYDPREVPGFEE